ncbi:hypothetical protein PF005_g17881 [Phytophthora fragariae]|uniref:Uncharacterized protein n=1 Tax=Phytophthora fragariae TaxID=53985 RepID=A0A6A3SP92_9STRA|nr:hypothetical protein PF003_g17051 [Phytophthora fragariae]KAE8929798.1 hypothetical protein PF009_g20093 [Phytophthora fragariae]KAE8988815.1 hypothetical protein PF011_g19027 [Phytophthora fragariae]KAE9087596.1 hypothetical protein PF007_g20313 [Phytophthora fragariae]KAE9087793.1 hypothetical protein PF010_g19598 [Phytophthora fragariae]
MRALVFSLLVFVLFIGAPVAANEREITLYQNTNFKSSFLDIRGAEVQTCYNLLCKGFENVASSADWSGWPEKASGHAGPPFLVFFTKKNCKGSYRGYSTYGESFPSDFAAVGLSDKIVSLIVYDKNFIDIDKTITFCEDTELTTVTVSNASSF